MKPVTILVSLSVLLLSCAGGTDSTAFEDLSHFSEKFGHDKSYRIYLPNDYSTSDKHYPVIYFFHGWGGRHFSDDNAKLDYERIDKLVEEKQVILVMWDGNVEETEPRPYNIGNHEDVKYDVQFKDYFPELVSHIDTNYRTLADRSTRGIIGYSMCGYFPERYQDMIPPML